MSLSNLQALGRLQAQPPDPPAMATLLQAADKLLAHTLHGLHTRHPEWGLA